MGEIVFALFFIPLMVVALFCAEQLTDFEEYVDGLNDVAASSRPES